MDDIKKEQEVTTEDTKGPYKQGGETLYKPEYCAMLIRHLEQGFSFESFDGAGVGRSTLYNWVEKYPEFKEAKEFGRSKGLKFFESLLRQKLTGKENELMGIKAKDIDTTSVIFALKTRYHTVYGERQKIEHTSGEGGIVINIDSDDAGL